MKIAPQGIRYTGLLLSVALVLVLFPPTRLYATPVMLLAAFVVFFFRDPERRPPDDPRMLVSPADGRVVHTGREDGPSDRLMVSIFLSLFDVHINRSPAEGTVERIRYTPGRFVPAYRSEASSINEQNELELRNDNGTIIVRQIAGVLARRIVCSKREGERLARGERFGLIQFGSRVDVILPPGVTLRVAKGDRVRGGETILAEQP